MNDDGKTLTFEEALDRLEAIIKKMEEGEVPLEQAMEYYAEGSRLSKLCHDKLQSADKQLKEIINEKGEREPFHLEEDD